LLSQVWHKPGISQTGVAYLLNLETMSVVRRADSLEQADLLQRRPHAGWGSCRRTGVSDPETVRQEALAAYNPWRNATSFSTRS
jgi:MarR family